MKRSKFSESQIVTLNIKGKPNTLVNAGSTASDGEFDVLVPNDEPINIRVTREGYEPWQYRDATKLPDAIVVKRNSIRKILVQMAPQK